MSAVLGAAATRRPIFWREEAGVPLHHDPGGRLIFIYARYLIFLMLCFVSFGEIVNYSTDSEASLIHFHLCAAEEATIKLNKLA